MLNLKEYFTGRTGLGVMSTSDSEGRVDAAVYSIPHVGDDGTLAFVMRARLTHKNLQSNPYAAFLFREDCPGYKGVRLFLKKLSEDSDPELVGKMIRRRHTTGKPEADTCVVFFEVEKVLPLIGSSDAGITVT